jgi:hypothetical protein
MFWEEGGGRGGEEAMSWLHWQPKLARHFLSHGSIIVYDLYDVYIPAMLRFMIQLMYCSIL